HHIGADAVDHRARLPARAAVRLLEIDPLIGMRLGPDGLELGVERSVEFARRVVGDIEETDAAARLRFRRARAKQQSPALCRRGKGAAADTDAHKSPPGTALALFLAYGRGGPAKSEQR